MKSDVFYWVLNMSLHGGLVCLIVLALRKLPRLPRGFVYALWLLPALRLCLPVGLRGRWSLMALLTKLGTRQISLTTLAPATPGPTLEDDLVEYTAQVSPGESLTGNLHSATITNSIQAAESYFPITYKTNVLTEVFETAALVWVIGAAACLLAGLILYICTRQELRHARPGEGYWISDRVTAPALYGVLRPRIILPEGVPATALPHILRHEQVHARRRDNLWRWAAVLLCCVHWFNPLCWLCLKYFFTDMELACDAAVLQKMDPSARKDYARALLDTAQSRRLFVSAFGGAKIRLRVQTVLSYKKLTATAIIAFTALFAAIAATLLMN
ncbi:MAG: peptidase M56 BlaR1 [Oscillospiraceae bacterium]|nr:peptidase M56 BlaR1 [Oscillospiraceae bacterium]